MYYYTLDLPCFGVLGDLPALEQWEVAGPTSISDGHTINTHQTIVFVVIYLCMCSGAIAIYINGAQKRKTILVLKAK